MAIDIYSLINVVVKTILVLGLSQTLLACAGPTSPFGALEFFSGDGRKAKNTENESELSEQILFKPDRQVLHAHTDWTVQVNTRELVGKDHEFQITYNGVNVTQTFKKKMSDRVVRSNKLSITFPSLRLASNERHKIDVLFRQKSGDSSMVLSSSYLPPECKSHVPLNVISTKPFRADSEVLESIHKYATHYDLNPTMLAGVIAQESAFNPKAISWARAVGLTQVTPLADAEIAKHTPGWPRDHRIKKSPVWKVRRLINEGQIQAQTDWRLNPSQSIEGGVLYFDYLKNYWERPENQALITQYAKGEVTPVLLASYNSGAARVKSQMNELQENWLDSSQLKEAFKYVNRVSSYCYHFAKADL